MEDFLEFLQNKKYFNLLRENLLREIPLTTLSTISTTVIALEYKDGALMACDSQVTQISNLDKLREPMKKIFIIDSYSVLGAAGAPSIASEVARVLKAAVSTEEKIAGSSLSCEGKILLLKRIVMEYFPLVLETKGELAAEFLFVSFDKEQQKPRFFSCDPIGSYWEYRITKYCAIGGNRGSHALNKLEESWQEGLIEKEAIKLGWEVLEFASQRNAGTGPPYYFFTITRKGIREIS